MRGRYSRSIVRGPRQGQPAVIPGGRRVSESEGRLATGLPDGIAPCRQPIGTSGRAGLAILAVWLVEVRYWASPMAFAGRHRELARDVTLIGGARTHKSRIRLSSSAYPVSVEVTAKRVHAHGGN
jgi:hypothetical protein